MATPYGHALVGLSLFSIWFPKKAVSISPLGVVAIILGSIAPDWDFLPGLLSGNPSRFHQGIFHSLGMAFGLALAGGAVIKGLQKEFSFFKISSFLFILVFSHLVLDFFTEDLKPPYGFPFLWPFYSAPLGFPWPVIPHVIRDFHQEGFVSQNLLVLGVETILFLPFYLLSVLRK
jgi:membrane-bound metal-dependent hydrolase YbcI (DUF457 family)